MDGFFQFFFEFFTEILTAFLSGFKGFFDGIIGLFDIPNYYNIYKSHSASFNVVDRITAILSIVLIIGIYFCFIYALYILIKKFLIFRKALSNQEALFVEVGQLTKQIAKLAKEKEEIMMMKIGQGGMEGFPHVGEENDKLQESMQLDKTLETAEPGAVVSTIKAPIVAELAAVDGPVKGRFFRLADVDFKYKSFMPPTYDNDITLAQICERYRNYACSKMNLYYDIKIVRLLVASMASSQIVILQGISGTGKTSLPYSFGKFLENDATIASVQPSWRDRTELFGYFNEFTKKFNETESLKRIYECSYKNDVNLLILDEMNIARVEYYFAEMLSILEMPDPNEWTIELVPNSWDTDPVGLKNGKLKIPQNLWYVGTANNDDSTFAVSDKVYDRAMVINIDTKGVAFDAPDTDVLHLGFDHLTKLFVEAKQMYPLANENIQKISRLDLFIIEKMRMAFGNRIVKQMKEFVPVYIACGGTEVDAIDYLLANKIFRKFESLNLAFIRDELDNLVLYLNELFGEENMNESKEYIFRLKKMM